MKNKYKIRIQLLLLLLMATTFIYAQIPNPGFETWTGSGSDYDATSWGDLNGSTGIIGVYTVQRATGANVHSGTYAMKLYTQYISFVSETAPGIAATTSINTTTDAIQGGFPLNYRPYKFKGWFKYAPSGTDTFSAQLTLFSGLTTGPVIGTAEFTSSVTVGGYTQFDVLVNYTGSGIPDSAQILLLSSSSYTPQTGSIAYVDDLSLVNCSNMAVSATPTAATCGLSDGSAVALASGASGPYTYAWSNSATGANLSSVVAASYTVVATDTDGCTASASAVISAANVAFTVNTSATPSCGHTNGQVVATATGGNSPYAYLWSNTDTSPNISGLTATIYNVTVTDNHGCTTTASANVSSANVPFTVGATATSATCTTSTGSVTTTASGGNAPYTYFWSNSDTAHNLSNIPSTVYIVTVTDAHGCTSSATTNVGSVNVPFTATAVPTATSCVSNTGTVTAGASAGNAPYTYLWVNSDTAHMLTSLGSGNYDVTVTDSHGCTSTASATVTTATGPSATDTVHNVTCNGFTNGAVAVTVTGGTAPLHYAWNNNDTMANLTGVGAGNYTLTITDFTGCSFQVAASVLQPVVLSITVAIKNVSCNGLSDGDMIVTPNGGTLPYSFNWSTGSAPDPAPAGNYSLTVTDAQACSLSASYYITQPPALMATASVRNIACFGQTNDSINVQVTGGTLPYSFLWSDLITDQNQNGMAAGIYSLAIADSNGCTASLTDTITSPSAALTASAVPTNVTCFDSSTGNITTTTSGGTVPYHYHWNVNNDTSANLSNLLAGSYTLTITDNNGCTASAPAVITQPASALSATVSVVNASSLTASDGSASVAVSGGTPPYTVNWITGSIGDTITHLQADTYTVNISDSLGCSIATYAVVGAPTGIGSINASLVKIYPNPANAQLIIQTNAADSKYLFSLYGMDGQLVNEINLTEGKTSVNLQQLSAGLYTYRLRDLNSGGMQYGKIEVQH